MRKIFGAALLVALTVGLLASPAAAADPIVQTGTVTGSPDNDPPGGGCDTWARDTFTRTTTITETATPGTYDIRQDIDGTWQSTANPAIHGTITGFVEYTITGQLLPDLDAVDDDVDLSALACKSNGTSPDTAGSWALRYFADGATKTGISDWAYTYDTACGEPYTEKDGAGAMGADVFPEPCPEPEPTTAAPTTAAPTTSAPSTTSAPTTAAPTGTTEATATSGAPTSSTAAAPTLPKTGSSLGGVLVAGGLLVVAGAGVLLWLSRQRRSEGNA